MTQAAPRPTDLIAHWIAQGWQLMLTCRGCARATTLDGDQLGRLSRGPEDTVQRIVAHAKCRQCGARQPYLAIVDTRPGAFAVTAPPG